MREDDIIVKLRVSTVADSASSIYDTMTKAADEIEILRSVGFLGVKPFLLGAPIASSNLSRSEFRRRRQRLTLSEELETSRK